MTDDVWTRDEPESPCVKICVMHPTARICIGCFRTIDEISSWSRLSSAERKAIKTELGSRADLLPKSRQGRAKRLKNRT